MIVSSDFRSFPNSWKMFFAEMFGAAMSGTIYRMAKNNSDDAINIRKIEQKANRLKRKSKTLDKMFNGSLQILRSIFSECVVYLHTKYPPIENLSPYEVDDFLAALAKLNNDYETVNEELVEPTGDEELLIDMGQYKWFNLNTNICSLEADAMGHCGNRYAKDGDNILSLRQVVKVAGKEYHRPSLTFIINNGVLGEMKGRANKKPDKKYHKYIMELLKHDMVRGIGNGGDDPKGNFEFDDLTDSQQEEIRDFKGSGFFTSPLEVALIGYKTTGKITGYEVLILMNYYVGRYYESININDIDGMLVFPLDDLIENNHVAKIVFAQDGIGHMDTEQISNYDDILSSLPTDKYDEVIKYIITNYRVDIEQHAESNDEEFSELYVLNNIDMLIDDLDITSISDSVNQANSDAVAAGTESEMIEATFKSIQKLCNELSVTLPENLYELYDKPYGIIRPESVEDFFKSHTKIQRVGKLELDLDEPYNGFDGYDEAVLKDSILAHLYDNNVLK